LNDLARPIDAFFVSRGRVLRFTGPVRVLAARTRDEVVPCLDEMESALTRGLYAAGFIAYEAAPAFHVELVTQPPGGDLPLLWFTLYRGVEESASLPPATPGDFSLGSWTAAVDQDAYLEAVNRIRELAAAGDTYQVNYTFPLEASFEGDALSWFQDLYRAQHPDYAAFLDTGRFQILSVSPELFFRLEDGRLEMRPMKGTRPRGRWPEEDRREAAALASSEKDKAENVMIVDLLRNDMGRISETGSVEVPRLFELERYDTVWQMTSTITSRTAASLPAIFSALFPSGSVTGAPKIRTMQIIRELERLPRGVYCGAVGWCGPGRRAEFNVAIRTVTIDLERGVATYPVGSGVTWASAPLDEYEECLIKARVLGQRRPDFELLESLLFDGEYFLLEEHLARLAASAEYFGFDVDVAAVRRSLLEAAGAWGGESFPAYKVRLLVARSGSCRIESGPAPSSQPVRVGFAMEPVDDQDVFLYHKTTWRSMYEQARAARSDCDDVLLWNARGEITETTVANIVLELDGRRLTPPVCAGLLAGTLRARLLADGEIQESVLRKEDVRRASAIWLINSVRKWVRGHLVE